MDLRLNSRSFWLLASVVAVGVWLMAAPGVLDLEGAARTNGHIVGPLVVSLATIALWEVVRGMRAACVPLGAWLFVAPLLFSYDDWAAVASDVGSGALIVALTLVSGRTTGRFGGGWDALTGDAESLRLDVENP